MQGARGDPGQPGPAGQDGKQVHNMSCISVSYKTIFHILLLYVSQ